MTSQVMLLGTKPWHKRVNLTSRRKRTYLRSFLSFTGPSPLTFQLNGPTNFDRVESSCSTSSRQVSTDQRASLLGERERASLLAVAQATMPEGRVFAGGGHARRRQARSLPVACRRRRWRAAIAPCCSRSTPGRWRAISGASRRCRRDEVLALLERWRTGDFARRTMVRMLTAPLKLAHFNDPAMYRERRLPLRLAAGARGASALRWSA